MSEKEKNVMSDANQVRVPTDVLNYMGVHLLDFLKNLGMGNTQIESFIRAMSPYEGFRARFLDNYLKSLPDGERQKATQRMRQCFAGAQKRITVVTLPLLPTIDVDATLTDRQIAHYVKDRFGLQGNEEKDRHRWEYEIVYARPESVQA